VLERATELVAFRPAAANSFAPFLTIRWTSWMDSATLCSMIWVLLIYTMGVTITMATLQNGFDTLDDPRAALMWPLLLLAFMIEWLEDK
jgi:hypothetical protein